MVQCRCRGVYVRTYALLIKVCDIVLPLVCKYLSFFIPTVSLKYDFGNYFFVRIYIHKLTNI
uniref:Uncharacterized protein n=1 Tax=Arundo donax TaxID=35708 RepID=A0A0A9FGL6_ARUDO